MTLLRLVIVFLILLVWGFIPESNGQATLQRGEINLAGFAGSNSESGIELGGEWLFVPNQFVEPMQAESYFKKEASSLFCQVPETWLEAYDQAGKRAEIDRYSYGSYLIKIEDFERLGWQDIGIFFRIDSAYRLYFFERQQASQALPISVGGQVGRGRSEEKPFLGLRPAFHRIDPMDLFPGSKFYLLIHVSNFHYKSGSVWEAPTIFPLVASERLMINSIMRQSIVIGMIFVLALYFISLFAHRSDDRATLWLGLLCLALSVRYLVTSDWIHYIVDGSEPTVYELIRKVEYISPTFSMYAIIAFFYYNFSDYFHRLVLRIVALYVISSSVLILLLPARIFTIYDATLQIGIMIVALYMLCSMVRAGLHRAPGARIALLGFLVVAIGLCHDTIKSYGIISTPFISSYTTVLFLFVQAQVVSELFAKTYREARMLNQELKRQEKIRTNFFHNTSHELRTPINGIMGFANLIRTGNYGAIPEKVIDQIQKIESLATALLSQVNVILDLAKFRSGSIQPIPTAISLQELMRDIAILGEALQARYKGCEFNLEASFLSPEDLCLYSDREKLATIIRNLLGNAFKFKDPERTNIVTFRAEYKQDINTLFIEVQDTGIGMEQQNLEQIFEEFSQIEQSARRRYEGTGLGLAMVKNLCQLLGINFEVRSEFGVGTSFRLQVPLQSTLSDAGSDRLVNEPLTTGVAGEYSYESSDEDDVIAEVSLSMTQIHSARILIVDDNPINCEVLRDILVAENYQVSVCTDSGSAIELSRQIEPDLILVDMMMPNLSGDDLLALLRKDQDLKAVPVIIVTARASQEDTLFGLRIGADDYLAKPILRDELLLRVNNLLTRNRLSKSVAEKMMIESSMARMQGGQNLKWSNILAEKGYKVETYYAPAETVGGDWYSIYLLENTGELFVLIGDVTGHGTASALVTLATAGAFNAMVTTFLHLNHAMNANQKLALLARSINHAVAECGQIVQRNMTMAFLHIDIESGIVTYLNAGHTPVLHQRGQVTETLLLPSSYLGSEAVSDFDQVTQFQLGVQETLLLYTDGLLENLNRNGRITKVKRLKSFLDSDGTVEQLKDRIFQECVDTSGRFPAMDDCTFVLIRREAPAKISRLEDAG